MNKPETCNVIKTVGIIPAIRVSSSDDAHFAVEAVARGGIPIVEITMTVPGALEVISHIVRFHPKVLVGAGTVLKVETAQQVAVERVLVGLPVLSQPRASTRKSSSSRRNTTLPPYLER